MLDNAEVIDSSPWEPSAVELPLGDAHERSETSTDQDASAHDDLTSHQAYYLYVSHFLSMWDSRMYEFAVVRPSTTSFSRIAQRNPEGTN